LSWDVPISDYCQCDIGRRVTESTRRVEERFGLPAGSLELPSEK